MKGVVGQTTRQTGRIFDPDSFEGMARDLTFMGDITVEYLLSDIPFLDGVLSLRSVEPPIPGKQYDKRLANHVIFYRGRMKLIEFWKSTIMAKGIIYDNVLREGDFEGIEDALSQRNWETRGTGGIGLILYPAILLIPFSLFFLWGAIVFFDNHNYGFFAFLLSLFIIPFVYGIIHAMEVWKIWLLT